MIFLIELSTCIILSGHLAPKVIVDELFYISVRDNFAKNYALIMCILILILYVNNSTMTKFDVITSKKGPILASFKETEFSLHHLVLIVLFQI